MYTCFLMNSFLLWDFLHIYQFLGTFSSAPNEICSETLINNILNLYAYQIHDDRATEITQTIDACPTVIKNRKQSPRFSVNAVGLERKYG